METRIITRGTLRPQDLLVSFADELESVVYDQGEGDKYGDLISHAHAISSEIEQVETHSEQITPPYEEAHYTLEDLREALNEHAPEGYEFRNCEHTPDEMGWFPIEDEDE